MNYRLIALIALCGSCMLGQGCTYRGWYEGLQERERQECYKYIGHDETAKCLDEVNSVKYDQYQQDRESLKKQ